MSVVRSLPSASSLRKMISGPVIAPGDAEYERARTVFAGDIDARPVLIARPGDAAEVATVIAFAREQNLPLAVRGGGHSPFCTIDDGVVLDTRGLTGLDIDPSGGTAWAGSGLTAGEYTRAVGVHGLATGFGDTGSVGIAGLTLGGGIGYLTRKYGLTIDSLRGADVVTADGRIVRADAGSHPDLFWALRGGGGNFGVVTRLHYALHAVPQVVGGLLLLPATVEVITGLVAHAAAAPDELSVIANVMTAPPLPFVPAAHHGALVVMALVCYAGDADAGERAIAPLRGLAPALVDMVRPTAYADLFPPEDDSFHPTAVGRTMFLDHVGAGEAALMLEHLQASDAPMRVVQLRVLGGAVARVPADATAFAHRSSRIMANVAAFYAGADERAARESWVLRLAARLRQQDGGCYVNFLGREGEARTRAAYPGATWQRLTAIKSQYDPDNVFRSNQNIAPARS